MISVHNVTNKTLLRESNTLSRESNYVVDVVMWPKFGNCSKLS